MGGFFSRSVRYACLYHSIVRTTIQCTARNDNARAESSARGGGGALRLLPSRTRETDTKILVSGAVRCIDVSMYRLLERSDPLRVRSGPAPIRSTRSVSNFSRLMASTGTTTRARAKKDAIDLAVEDYVTDTDNLATLFSPGEPPSPPLTVASTSFLGGSSWSSAYKLTATAQSDPARTLDLFVKTARGRPAESMFKGEAVGLTAMRLAAPSLAVPRVHTYGDAGGGSYIIMEYMNFTSGRDMRALGRAVGEMHANGTADAFGFAVDNTIGGTPQPNGWMDDWVEFFKVRRLQHQVDLANDARLKKMCDELVSSGKYERLFENAVLRPALLHGDLWSGNIGWADGKPSLFDPATYYGHSEAEFGMSWCAGLSGEFYRAYHEVVPRADGFDRRHDLYTLYHYLNHYNLFGSGYYGNCERLFARLLQL